MRLLKKQSCVGGNMHRHGWPYVVNHIKNLDTGKGIIFDDFIEQTFMGGAAKSIPHQLQTEKWVAMVHVSPDILPVFSTRSFTDYHNCVPGGDKAFENLVGLCTMSHHMARRLREVSDIPVEVIHYPTDTNVLQFNIQEYLHQPQIVHVGWCRKNILLLEHIPMNQHINDKIYVKSLGLPLEKENQVIEYCQQLYPNRKRYDDVKYIPSIQQHRDYDALLAKSVVAIEFIDCSATTVVVEALARCVPILVNRHPALTEYLGKDYPMFFENIEECTNLLHPDNIIKTHKYIQTMDRSFLHIDNFISQFSQWIQKHE